MSDKLTSPIGQKEKPMKNKYNNDAIIGGGNITASLTEKGELLRVMYPAPDFRNWIDEFVTGVKINDSGRYSRDSK